MEVFSKIKCILCAGLENETHFLDNNREYEESRRIQ